MIIELSLLCYSRYRNRRLRHHLARYPDYLLKDMGLRVEGDRIVSDRDEAVSPMTNIEHAPPRSRAMWLWQGLLRRL